MIIKPPSPPYFGPPFHSIPGHNKPIHRIVLHSTVSPCEAGGARATANYFKSRNAGGSAHYTVDPVETIQAAYDDLICWHAPPNANSLGIEMCDEPGVSASRPAPIARWDDAPHTAMLERVAHLTARLCVAYSVPVKWLSSADLLDGAHGITSHANVSGAWHESMHWDPGMFPHDAFVSDVQKRVAHLTQR